ncbi:hypothetical protein Tco_0597694 [Tanacetum coccineum]
MYRLHVNLRSSQDELRTAQYELVQVNVGRGRVAFFNKMLILLVLAMFLIRILGYGVKVHGLVSCDVIGFVLSTGIIINKKQIMLVFQSYGQ